MGMQVVVQGKSSVFEELRINAAKTPSREGTELIQTARGGTEISGRRLRQVPATVADGGRLPSPD